MSRRPPQPLVPLVCEVCKKTVMLSPSAMAKGRRRCSVECYAVHLSQGAYYECANCLKRVPASPTLAKTRKYCSMKCLKEHKKARISCEVCGKVRAVTPTVLKNGARFCSQECSRTALNKPRPVITCVVCGKQKEVFPYEARKGRKFCSYTCRSIHTMLNTMGKKPTRIEMILGETLTKMKLEFIAQHPIPSAHTIVDAFVPALNLAIYADGIYWHSLSKSKRRDAFINRTLKEQGYKILRLSEPDIINDCHAALEAGLVDLGWQANGLA